MERDVVCGMQVDPARAAGSTEHEGKTYYFCSKGCLQRFQTDPGKYLDPAYRPGMHAMHAAPAPLTLVRERPRTGAPEPSPPRTLAPEYTCPMHPDVRPRA